MVEFPTATDVLVIGAGPAGSAAAAWAARGGRHVVLADAAIFPRDKTCGDGLTPRAVAELDRLGLGAWVRDRIATRGARLVGWRRSVQVPWPPGSLPTIGSAVARTELDDRIRLTAVESGATMLQGARAVDVTVDGGRATSVVLDTADGPRTIRCRNLLVADGARSTLGKRLGRIWHRDRVYGVAARAYAQSGRSAEEWLSAHELRDSEGKVRPGYGWVFPLGNGTVNLGVAAIATAQRPAGISLRQVLDVFTAKVREEWELDGPIRAVKSALLPMGGSVSGIAGRNWALVGDAAACVLPTSGEGIDYALEGGRLAADLLAEPDLTDVWPTLLRDRFGGAFSMARRTAGAGTMPGVVQLAGRLAAHSKTARRIGIRVMGNYVTEDDRDLLARAWRRTGRASMRLDRVPPFS